MQTFVVQAKEKISEVQARLIQRCTEGKHVFFILDGIAKDSHNLFPITEIRCLLDVWKVPKFPARHSSLQLNEFQLLIFCVLVLDFL